MAADRSVMSSDSVSHPPGGPSASSLPPPRPIENGVSGVAAGREDRRHGPSRPDSSHSVVWNGARAVLTAPRSAGRWVRGAFAERRLGNRLDRELGPVAVVLHAREVPETTITIDHIVVASSGVWVVVADHTRGAVRRRRPTRGGAVDPESTDERSTSAGLIVGGDERRDLVDAVERRAAAVRSLLYPIGFEWMDVHRAVCFTNANFRLFARPFTIDGSWAIRARGLVDRIAVPGPVAPDVMRTVGVELSSRLPAVR